QWTGPFTNLLLATFTNGIVGSAVTNFTTSIQWGDNSISAGIINTNTAKIKQVFGSHTYVNSGVYPIAITIQSGLGVTAVVTNAIAIAPSLLSMQAGSNVQLAWPAWAYLFGLQSCSNLINPVWVNVTNSPTLVGFQNMVSNTPSSVNLFFRLKK
ncbi:MAG TPA: hypothetical protein VMH87_20785, partial [Pseudomonadales bacterium]|nr:hypothetical protein [Pseudomonadales bacterium]